MWPTIFEFSWDTGHMIFFGVFYAIAIAIATSIVYAVTRSIVDMFTDAEDVLSNHLDERTNYAQEE